MSEYQSLRAGLKAIVKPWTKRHVITLLAYISLSVVAVLWRGWTIFFTMFIPYFGVLIYSVYFQKRPAPPT